MGKGYLIDSNSIIDFFDDTIPINGRILLSNIDPNISIVTFIEIFSKAKLSEKETEQLKDFAAIATIYDVDREIALITIELRKLYRIKLPDALIAATALCKGLILITRNVTDFNKIENLEIINPHLI